METIIVDILTGVNPLLGVMAAFAAVVIGYLAKELSKVREENRNLRSQYTSDLKENIESMVEINHTIRNLIEKGDIRQLETKIDGLVNLVGLINHTLASLERNFHHNGK